MSLRRGLSLELKLPLATSALLLLLLCAGRDAQRHHKKDGGGFHLTSIRMESY